MNEETITLNIVAAGMDITMRVKKEMEFNIPNIPRARQSMRVGAVTDKHGQPVYETYGVKNNKPLQRIKIAKFQSKDSVNDYAYLKWSMVSKRKPGSKPWDGPIVVDYLIHVFPPVKAHKGDLFKATKPDLVDNLNKAFFDAMKGILIMDDQQIIAIKTTMKVYGEIPGIYIRMLEVEPRPVSVIFKGDSAIKKDYPFPLG